jgi:hypothetical protein
VDRMSTAIQPIVLTALQHEVFYRARVNTTESKRHADDTIRALNTVSSVVLVFLRDRCGSE